MYRREFPEVPMDKARLIAALESSATLDSLGKRLAPIVRRVVAPPVVRDALTGRRLGHPAHPMLVIGPLSCWLGTTTLDVIGGRSARRAANRLCGLGIVLFLPTAAAGAADWLDTEGAEKRVGTAHAIANNVALLLYVQSRRRRRSSPAAALVYSVLGATALGVGGYLGGHLAYRRGVGVDTTAFAAGPTEWTLIGHRQDFAEGKAQPRSVGGVPLVVVANSGELHVLEDRCTHRGGPLHEGEVDGTCVTCPWHGSAFNLRDGSIVTGPASAPQPVYDVRVLPQGQVEVRRGEQGALRLNPVR
jgi:nitrite reductase/ring-hydroxylating ferredoxin subunit/uncharacterized membrane protein